MLWDNSTNLVVRFCSFGGQMTAVYSCFIAVSDHVARFLGAACARQRHQKLCAGFLNLQAWATCLASKRGLHSWWLVEVPDLISLGTIKLLYRSSDSKVPHTSMSFTVCRLTVRSETISHAEFTSRFRVVTASHRDDVLVTDAVSGRADAASRVSPHPKDADCCELW